LQTGLTFGLTSGVITTLGLMVGLHSGTHSRLAVIGGIVTIAVADALSDALGVHVSKEAENRFRPAQLWVATFATFAAKLATASTFILPVVILDLETAIRVSVAWGLVVLGGLSYVTARVQGSRPLAVVAEHLAIALAVVLITHALGDWIAATFGAP
jgi:VIT1/CCC1 family predicted Fe2+/Mn2+ transporter